MKTTKAVFGMFTLLVALAFLMGGCGKSSSPSGDNQSSPKSHDGPPVAKTEAPPIVAEPFHGQVYKSLNGATVLTLVSKDECEIAENGTTLLCKYTKQDGKLRVVTTALGTSQVLYFLMTDQGLDDGKGNLLLSPDKYKAAIEAAMLEQERQARMKREAEEKRLAEEKQKAEEAAKRAQQFYTMVNTLCKKGATFDMGPGAHGYWVEVDRHCILTISDTPTIAQESGETVIRLFGTVHWKDKVPKRVANTEAKQDHKVQLAGSVYKDNDGSLYADLKSFWYDPSLNAYANTTDDPVSRLSQTKEPSGYLCQRADGE